MIRPLLVCIVYASVFFSGLFPCTPSPLSSTVIVKAFGCFNRHGELMGRKLDVSDSPLALPISLPGRAKAPSHCILGWSGRFFLRASDGRLSKARAHGMGRTCDGCAANWRRRQQNEGWGGAQGSPCHLWRLSFGYRRGTHRGRRKLAAPARCSRTRQLPSCPLLGEIASSPARARKTRADKAGELVVALHGAWDRQQSPPHRTIEREESHWEACRARSASAVQGRRRPHRGAAEEKNDRREGRAGPWFAWDTGIS